MTVGLIGRKVGMTQVFQEDGTMVAVSVLEVAPNVVTRLRTVAVDGYTAATPQDGVAWFNAVSDGYFTTLGTALLAGRDFTPQDAAGAQDSAGAQATGEEPSRSGTGLRWSPPRHGGTGERLGR